MSGHLWLFQEADNAINFDVRIVWGNMGGAAKLVSCSVLFIMSAWSIGVMIDRVPRL